MAPSIRAVLPAPTLIVASAVQQSVTFVNVVSLFGMYKAPWSPMPDPASLSGSVYVPPPTTRSVAPASTVVPMASDPSSDEYSTSSVPSATVTGPSNEFGSCSS